MSASWVTDKELQEIALHLGGGAHVASVVTAMRDSYEGHIAAYRKRIAELEIQSNDFETACSDALWHVEQDPVLSPNCRKAEAILRAALAARYAV